MNNLKQLAREIFRDTLAGVSIARAFEHKVLRRGSSICAGDVTVDLAQYRSIRVVAMGKAATAMARGFVAAAGQDVEFEGVLAAPHDALADVPGFRVIGAAHPVPDEGSFAAGRA